MASDIQNNNLSLNYDDGFKQVTINNDPERVIRWNPNDANFVDKFLEFQDWIEGDFKTRLQGLGISKEKKFEEYDKGSITELGKEMCRKIDDTFGRNISGPAFSGINPISPMSNGSLLFVNFIEALMPMIENSIKDFDKSRKKYTDAAKKITKAVVVKDKISLK